MKSMLANATVFINRWAKTSIEFIWLKHQTSSLKNTFQILVQIWNRKYSTRTY
jgi:hypothetical protein